MKKLREELGLIHVFCISSGALISSGLFVLPGIAHARAGPAVVLSYLLAGVLGAIGLLSVAELSTAMPKPGGDYFFISRSLGPGVGVVAGLLSWFSLSLKAAFALIGIGAVAAQFLAVDPRLVGVLFCAAFVVINLRGSREAAGLQVVLTVFLLLVLVAFVGGGVPHMDGRNLAPLAPYGMHSIFSTAGFVFVAYGAAVQVASMAGETRAPGRNIPLGILLSITIVTGLYVAVVGVTTGVLPSEQLDESLTPIADAARVFWGGVGVIVVSIGALLAFLSTVNSGIITASRYLVALSRDSLAPRLLGRVGGKSGAPRAAILCTGGLIAIALFVVLDILVEAASVVFVLTYMLASVSVIILRESGVQNYRPKFHAPLYPYLQVAGILGFLLVLWELGVEAYLICGSLVVVGLALYWFYGRSRHHLESALLHLVERITDQKLVSGMLEQELREIIRERDTVPADRLDQLVQDCPVLDLDEPLSAEEFFRLVGKTLAPELDEDGGELAEKLIERERQASTVVQPGVAMPHLVIEKPRTFQILLARAKAGITFTGETEPVHAVFVLAGSQDERHFHLRAMAAFAQIIMGPEFKKRWMNATNTDRLRDVLFLEERMRVR
jgi:amino acid transporter/mannitol/fructose-specific phosphotransferase system IIA component (Ntr-type)